MSVKESRKTMRFVDRLLYSIAKARAGEHLDYTEYEPLRNVKGLSRVKAKRLHRRLLQDAALFQADAKCNRDLHYSLGYRDGLLDAADGLAELCEHKTRVACTDFDVPAWVNRGGDAA